MSQSPLTGQFNFYWDRWSIEERKTYIVSIPSNGSIQFLLKVKYMPESVADSLSQSPLTGQFNFYIILNYQTILQDENSLNPL